MFYHQSHIPERSLQAGGLGIQSAEYPGPIAPFQEEEMTLATSSIEHTSGYYHVIVVHHCPDILNIMGAMFRKFRYRVTTACDSAKALLYFGRKHCDLLFTDLDMPVLNGYDLARLIKKHSPQTKAVAMTCRCQAELVDLMGDGVIDGWLYKPFNTNEFRDTLTDIGMGRGPTTFEAKSMNAYGNNS